MKFNVLKELLLELRRNKYYIISGLVIMIFSFLLPVITEGRSNLEDGFIETMTAFFLLIISVFYLILFIRKRHIVNILFFLLFLFACGEEISWGQRILKFDTPSSLKSENLQGEFNIHNLKLFNAVNEEGHPTKGLNFNLLFVLFCLGYGIVLPFLVLLFGGLSKFVTLLGVDVPPLSIGSLFVVKSIISQLFFSGPIYTNLRIGESSEFISVFILFLITLTFVKERKNI